MFHLLHYLPSASSVAGYAILTAVHWQDPAAWLGYGLVLFGAIVHLFGGRTQKR